ncbi:MAG: hypothetical protein Q9170_004539 [Blastenia crenularia]
MTPGERVGELGRARQMQERVRARLVVVDAERNRLFDECLQRNHQLQELDREKHRLEAELRELGQRLQGLEGDLGGSGTDMKRARQTIQEQSLAAWGPREPTSRPSRNNRLHDNRQPSQAESRFVQNFGFGDKPVAIQRRADPRESAYAPPGLQTSAYRPENQLTTSRNPYSNDARNDVQPQHQSFIAAPKRGLQLRPAVNDNQSTIQWQTELSTFFTKIERFCADNLNVPHAAKDQDWPVALASTLANESHPSHIASLVSDRRTRPLLIARIILDWVQSHIFLIKIMKGFSKSSDKGILDLRKQISAAPNDHIRRAFTQTLAEDILNLTRQEGFDAWKAKRIREDTELLLKRLEDTVPPNVHRAILHTTFESLLADAWRIGLMMATRTLAFEIRFFPAGKLYDPNLMRNRDPYKRGGTTEELVRGNTVVALTVTPFVSVRDTILDTKEVQTLCLAGVVLRY